MQASTTRRQMAIGGVIMSASITLFFAWGMSFKLFGHAIRLDLPTVGFFAWLLMGMFGVGYAHGGRRGGARMAVGFAGLAAIAVMGGILRGAYR